VRALPVIADCTLSVDGLTVQRSRASALRPAVERLERRPASLAVTFGPGIDRRLLDELIATERGCCSFLAIDYDEPGRALRIGIDDLRHTDVLDAFTAFFSAEVAA
jgi:hypothetical protein